VESFVIPPAAACGAAEARRERAARRVDCASACRRCRTRFVSIDLRYGEQRPGAEQSDNDLLDQRGTKDAAGKVILTASYVTTGAGALNSHICLPGKPRTYGAFAAQLLMEEKKP